MESENEKEIEDAVKNILKSCILSRIKIEDLATFDLEYLFLRIRAASVGEEIKLKVTCIDDGETEVDVTINLLDVQVAKPENHSNKIMISDDMGLVMKYPSMDKFVKITLLNKDLETTDEVFGMLADCIDQIFQADEVWDVAETPRKDVINFIESLTQKQFEKIQEFFETMPILKHEFTVVNPNTGNELSYKLEGLQSFFA